MLFGKDCGHRRKIDGVHGFAISSAVCLGGFVATGSLDTGVLLTPLVQARRSVNWVLVALLVLLLAAVLGWLLRGK
jgi:hypothetical protein